MLPPVSNTQLIVINRQGFKKGGLPILSNIKIEELPLAGLDTVGAYDSEIQAALKRGGCILLGTARAYRNDYLVGKAIRKSGIDPEGVFIDVKLSKSDLLTLDHLRAAIKESTEFLGKVPDMFTIQKPYRDVPMLSIWAELYRMQESGEVRKIGTKNFNKDQLLSLINQGYKPAVNQMKINPYSQNYSLCCFCEGFNIQLQTYNPFADDRALSDPTVLFIAKEFHSTPSQVISSWLAHKKIAILGKATQGQFKELASSSLLCLSASHMHAIDNLDRAKAGDYHNSRLMDTRAKL